MRKMDLIKPNYDFYGTSGHVGSDSCKNDTVVKALSRDIANYIILSCDILLYILCNNLKLIDYPIL